MRISMSFTIIVLLSCGGLVKADDATDSLSRSYTLEANRDYAGAAKVIRQIIDTTSRSYFLHLRLGYLSALAGDHVSASTAYRSAAELEPKALEPLLGAQLALANAGMWSEAIEVGRKAVALDRLNYLARSRLAWALYKRREYREAASTYRSVLANYPGDIEMWVGLGWAHLGAGNAPDAAAAFRQVLGMSPKHVGATAGLATIPK
jgi:tetratricopeptide (TPR) repeat protein